MSVCDRCGVELEREGALWVDAAVGGTYDWCDHGSDNTHEVTA